MAPADDHFGLIGASWHIPDVVDSSLARDEVRKVEIMGVRRSFYAAQTQRRRHMRCWSGGGVLRVIPLSRSTSSGSTDDKGDQEHGNREAHSPENNPGFPRVTFPNAGPRLGERSSKDTSGLTSDAPTNMAHVTSSRSQRAWRR